MKSVQAVSMLCTARSKIKGIVGGTHAGQLTGVEAVHELSQARRFRAGTRALPCLRHCSREHRAPGRAFKDHGRRPSPWDRADAGEPDPEPLSFEQSGLFVWVLCAPLSYNPSALKPWLLIDSAPTPDGTPLELWRRGAEFAIRAAGRELMSSRAHGSEMRLAELGVAALGKRQRARVLVGGLGCGYTLAAALSQLEAMARVVVSEISTAVVNWNRGILGELAGHPLNDSRVEVRETDIAKELGREPYDLILLDVDNGPRAFTQAENGWLYGDAGIAKLRATLKSGGVLGVWSAGPDTAFSRRLQNQRFRVEEHSVRAHSAPSGKAASGKATGGKRHILWLATRVD